MLRSYLRGRYMGVAIMSTYKFITRECLIIPHYLFLCILSLYMWTRTTKMSQSLLQIFFGISGHAPQIIGYTRNDDGKKFVLDEYLTLENLKAFREGFYSDTLKPFCKSDLIPEDNDGDVTIVVGSNFDDIVLDESKDVLLEIYAPWCGHCQALEPTYSKLAKHLLEINSLVIAKMDGSTNEHPMAKSKKAKRVIFPKLMSRLMLSGILSGAPSNMINAKKVIVHSQLIAMLLKLLQMLLTLQTIPALLGAVA